MTVYHILIVEDQRDLARMIRSGLHSLGHEFNVVDVPSGEEALLLAGRKSLDLLILDINLPGISGFELMDKLKRQQPDLKTILITGLRDYEVRKQIANAGAEAFFFKPIELGDILETVEELLNLRVATPLEDFAEDQVEDPAPSLSDRISTLRQDLNATTAVILNERGQSVVQAGDLALLLGDTPMTSALLAVHATTEKVSQMLGTRPPESITHFRAEGQDLYLAHLSDAYLLLAVVPRSAESPGPEGALPILGSATHELRAILSQLGVPVASPEEAPLPVPPIEEESTADIEVETPDLEAVLQQATEESFETEDVDAFWDSVEQQFDTGSLNPDSLTYDQARKLGLTPNDE